MLFSFNNFFVLPRHNFIVTFSHLKKILGTSTVKTDKYTPPPWRTRRWFWRRRCCRIRSCRTSPLGPLYTQGLQIKNTVVENSSGVFIFIYKTPDTKDLSLLYMKNVTRFIGGGIPRVFSLIFFYCHSLTTWFFMPQYLFFF